MVLSLNCNMDTDTDDNIEINLENQNPFNVVIRTLKERCYLLQQRLKTVEKENIQLALDCSKSNTYPPQDTNVLNENLTQLSKEKTQLTHHVFMVTCENKKLWSRLLELTKSKDSHSDLETDCSNKNNAINIETSAVKDNTFTVPHLIRSQTFTTSPNPKLKPRIEESNENIEASLEEISLKVISSILAEKNELVQQYEQMVELQMTNDNDLNLKSMGFSYLDDMASVSLADIKQYMNKLIDLKKEVSQQKVDMKNFISRLEASKSDECSPEFNQNKNAIDTFKTNKSECFDASETEMLESLTRWATPANSTLYHDNIEDTSFSHNTSKISQNNTPSSINTKNVVNSNSLQNDNPDKICPICGEHFKNSVLFEVFTKHVEAHFVGDENYDSIVDNYDVLINSIGNNFN